MPEECAPMGNALNSLPFSAGLWNVPIVFYPCALCDKFCRRQFKYLAKPELECPAKAPLESCIAPLMRPSQKPKIKNI